RRILGHESLPVERRDFRATGIYEVGEGGRDAQLSGPGRALRRRSQKPEGRNFGPARKRLCQPVEGMIVRKVVLEVRQQFGELLWEVVRRGLSPVTLQRKCRKRIRARGAADP